MSHRVFTYACAVWVGCTAASAVTAHAQVELTGTYVRYLAIGSDGTMICDTGSCAGRSMQYAEATTDTPSCDLYYPGSPVETFTLEATPAGGIATVLTNTGNFGIDEFTTTAGPTVVGRTITWSGTAAIGATTVRIDQTFELQTGDRSVRLSVTVTNTGTVALSDVYYLRNGDPDHGSCSIGFDFATANDVRRQPPVDDSALATTRGGDAAGTGRSLVLGIGAHDPRARAHNGGFENTDASGEWTAPVDHAGLSADEGVDLVFREPTLAAGASTTFEMFYVWGRTEAEVETRFDELGFPSAPCTGLAEGAACSTSAGDAGLCRAGRCCTGCFDGSRCRAGNSASSCGAAGAMCASCADSDLCTTDLCTAGACSNPVAPAGTTCDDGLFCTARDTCDAAGACVGGGGPRCNDGMSCTADTCEEASDTCVYTAVTGCTIGGSCVADGTMNPTYPCQVCDPTRSTTDWSPRAVGTECATASCVGGRITTRTCDAAAACVASLRMPCPTGVCADAQTCEAGCAPEDCASGEHCDPITMQCEPQRANGDDCADAAACISGACVDGVCCESICDGTCERCDMLGMEGACAPVLAGEDPDDECALACDGAGACERESDGGMLVPPDASTGDRDAAAQLDAGTTADSGTGGTTRGGCGCSAPGSSRSLPLSLALALLVLGVLARRLRKR